MHIVLIATTNASEVGLSVSPARAQDPQQAHAVTASPPPPVVVQSYPNWLYSPGFGGAAAIAAAIVAVFAARIQAAGAVNAQHVAADAAAERDEKQRALEGAAIRRELRGYLVDLLQALDTRYTDGAPNEYTVSVLEESIDAFHEKAKALDLPRLLSDHEFYVVRLAVTSTARLGDVIKGASDGTKDGPGVQTVIAISAGGCAAALDALDAKVVRGPLVRVSNALSKAKAFTMVRQRQAELAAEQRPDPGKTASE